MAYPRVLELAAWITQHGYGEVEVYSPCTRLADRAFAAALIEALPPKVTFAVPLYATRAERHDEIVGRDGSYAQLMAALANLKALGRHDAVKICTVALSRNLDELHAISDWATARGWRFSAHTPFPSTESPRDPFFQVAASFTQIAEAALTSAAQAIKVRGVPPCVLFRRARALDIPPAQWLALEAEGEVHLPGRDYRSHAYAHNDAHVQHSAFVASSVRCLHATPCALRTACAEEVLRVYSERYGLEELSPVSLAALLQTASAP